MKTPNMQIWLAIFMFCCAIGVSQAINCYECTSILDGDSCADPFNSASKKDGCAQCGKAKYEMDGNQVVARTCVPVSIAKNDCESGDYQGVSADLCYCSGDLCNTSSHVTVSLVTSLCAGALALFLKKLF